MGEWVARVDVRRDRPAGQAAVNWSRRDGIRGGAVTGPWRSAPRATPETAADAVVPPREAVPEALPVRPVRDVAPHPPAKPRRESPEAGADRPGTGVFSGVAFGTLVAIGLVVLAFVLRPAPAEVTGAIAGAEVAIAELAGPSRVAGGPVQIRVGPDLSEARLAEIVAALVEAGFSDIEVETLPVAITQSRVGFNQPDDRFAAETLVRLIAPVVPQVAIRDYGTRLTDAEPGELDLWVSG